MNNVTYLNGWEPNLCIQLVAENQSRLLDFNRFLIKHFHKTEMLQQGGQFQDAERKELILRLKSRFDENIEEGVSNRTLISIFVVCSQYLRWCDTHDKAAFVQASLEGFMFYQQTRVLQGLIKRSTYKQRRSLMFVIFLDFLDFPSTYFNNVPVMGSSDSEPFEAYTRSDLNQLLPFLRSLFKQTYAQFIQAPEIHMGANKKTATMTFNWKGQTYLLYAGISKMMSAATYLLSYYTYANTSDLFNLKQPSNASMAVGETWYTMPAFKRRAFKTIQVEMGEHELDIPKYAMHFFDNLLNASRLISSAENTNLLQTVIKNASTQMSQPTLQTFLKQFIDKHFSFTDQRGRRLRPMASRFRETGAQITAYHQGEMLNDIMLSNTPTTRQRHYSEGNRTANNGMMQDAMSIREEEIKSGINTKEAQANLGIKVLVIEEEYKINLPELSRTPNGTSCTTPFGEKSEKYTKRAIRQGLLPEGKRLACADLLACFGCPSQVIVQSLADIWCLLSFKACLEESLYLHLDASHYRRNFEAIVVFIEGKILPSIQSQLLKQAEAKLADEGHHPYWQEADAVLGLIPKS
ncbi:hypothetical protein WG68_13215 [Arsukibacterium ikkense]|uniref:Uncharacterized protein n=2 Tax=Arsukibacterium ikkense TaxID=336831 RepID=A0A0M2V329_9GAMM|nr:hypothetical protein WG68_13215 [Arsukibacterium ikkense]